MLPLWLDLDGHLGRSGSVAADSSNHHPQALKAIPPDTEAPGRCALRPLESRPMLLVDLILYHGEAVAGCRPQKLKCDRLTMSSVRVTAGAAGGSGAGSGKSTCTAPVFPM